MTKKGPTSFQLTFTKAGCESWGNSWTCFYVLEVRNFVMETAHACTDEDA